MRKISVSTINSIQQIVIIVLERVNDLWFAYHIPSDVWFDIRRKNPSMFGQEIF